MEYCYSRTIPVEEGIDVIVAGGGPAGYSAAISAARLGAKVVLVEMHGFLGGLATTGLVTRMDTTSDGRRMIVGGVLGELLHAMYERGYIAPYYDFKRFTCQRGMYSPFSPEGMKLLLDEMAEEAGVDVRFFTRVIDVQMDQNSDAPRVEGVIVSDVEGLHLLRAKCFVDATGDAVLAELAGAPCWRAGTPEAPNIMPPTMCSFFSNIPWDEIPLNDKTPVMHGPCFRQAMEDGFFSQPDQLVPGIGRNCADTGGMNAGHLFGLDALNARMLSDGMRQGRRQVQEYADFYRKYVPGFANMQLVATGAYMGIRESRRIIGEYTLTYEDYQARRQFPDQIGIYSKTVDLHPYDLSQAEYDRFRRQANEPVGEGECYGLPYGMIVPRGFVNLWVAGRCSSSDRLANSAVRVQPSSAILGHAAGVAAWLCAQDGASAVSPDMPRILSTLQNQGAILA